MAWGTMMAFRIQKAFFVEEMINGTDFIKN